MDSSILAMAAGLGASFSQGTRPMGPPSHCSQWVLADADVQNFLANNPAEAIRVALDAQPYNNTWQEAFADGRWWGRKRVTQHRYAYYYCSATLPQNGPPLVLERALPRPPVPPSPQPPIVRAAGARRYRFP